MNRIQLVIAAVVCALPVIACTSSAPAQQPGVTTYQETMSQSDAQKLVASLNEAGHHCYAPCSYGPADANGNVVFEADLNCNGDTADMCTLLVDRFCQ